MEDGWRRGREKDQEEEEEEEEKEEEKEKEKELQLCQNLEALTCQGGKKENYQPAVISLLVQSEG